MVIIGSLLTCKYNSSAHQHVRRGDRFLNLAEVFAKYNDRIF